MYKRNEKPKRSSRFICMKCMRLNQCGSGIQRGEHQREKYHIKDLICVTCQGEITKNLEVRFCDDYEEVLQKAMEIRRKYYRVNGNRKAG